MTFLVEASIRRRRTRRAHGGAVCKVALSAYTYSGSVRANEVDQTPGQEAWSIPHYRGVAAYMNTKNAALERVHEASGGCSAALEMRVPLEGVIASTFDGKVRQRGPFRDAPTIRREVAAMQEAEG